VKLASNRRDDKRKTGNENGVGEVNVSRETLRSAWRQSGRMRVHGEKQDPVKKKRKRHRKTLIPCGESAEEGELEEKERAEDRKNRNTRKIVKRGIGKRRAGTNEKKLPRIHQEGKKTKMKGQTPL